MSLIFDFNLKNCELTHLGWQNIKYMDYTNANHISMLMYALSLKLEHTFLKPFAVLHF